jgi:hypothetical protein
MRTVFRETMSGRARLTGEPQPRPIVLDLAADVPGLLRLRGDVEARLTGRVRIGGWADDTEAAGSLRIAPVAARRIRYRLTFTTSDRRTMRLDGWKSVSFARPVRSMTTLPATITDEQGRVAGEARLGFDLRRSLGPMLASVRLRPDAVAGVRAGGDPAGYLPSRWRGQPGRLEVWYTTLTDPATGTGCWLHHELVAPADGGKAYAHGWAAVFPPDSEPVLARFGPEPWQRPAGDAVFATSEAAMTPQALRGSAGFGGAARGRSGDASVQISWDLTADPDGPPLFTFPRWAWEREVLPGAQIVPVPAAAFHGTIRFSTGSHGGRVLTLDGAPGATARSYGHGNAERWAWLHADLGGGDVCEVVAAVSTRPGLNKLAPLPLVRLRAGGADWPPGGPLVHAARFIARIGLPTWTVLGVAGDRRIRIQVTQPAQRTLAVSYTDPDGSTAVCRNSERADVVINLQRRAAGVWQPEHVWRLRATAHAEVGTRE